MKHFLTFVPVLAAILLLGCKKEPYLSVNVTELSFTEAGGSQTLMVSANYPWTVSLNGTGFSVSPSSGTGDCNVTVTAAAASSDSETQGKLVFRSEELSASVNLKQEAKTMMVISAGAAPVNADPAGGFVSVDFQFNTEYTVEVEPAAQSWIEFYGTKALSSATLQFIVEPNTLNVSRSGKVTIKADSGKVPPVTFTITQEVDVIRQVLMDMYNTMGGTSWTNPENWATDKPVSSWRGVDYNTKTHELTLSLEGFGLKGPLPESIGDLGDRLTFFLIEDELGMTGPLPDSFRKLTGLKNIFFWSTGLTSIPDAFGDMKSLEQVRICCNPNLTGPLPKSFGELSKIKYLALRDNRFTGELPASLAKFAPNLSFDSNCLTGKIPDEYFATKEYAWLLSEMYQKEGYGFDISENDIHGGRFWPTKSIEDLNGELFTFEEVIRNNKYTVYLEWAPWCPFSKELVPQLRDYYKKYRSDGLEVIATVMVTQGGAVWEDLEGQKKEVADKGYGQWYNFYFPSSEIGSYLMHTPSAEVYDSNGNIVFSSFSSYSDPVRKRFGKTASSDLIPFLESLFGPAEAPDPYASTDFSRDGEVVTLQKATVGKGINIVFMGDGYTDKDMGPGGFYETLMKQAMDEFFALEPYKTFRDRFNVYAVKAVSKNARIGDGAVTALETGFGNGSEVFCNNDKCFNYALKVPGITTQDNLLVCVLVNTGRHCGTTYMTASTQSAIAISSSQKNDPDVFGHTLRHEAGGHGFGFLADEYVQYSGKAPDAHVEYYNAAFEKYGWFSNVDFTNDASKIRWSVFLSDDRYKDEVGVFEGAALYEKGAYRPSENGMMREDLDYYNAPSRWAIYQRIMKLSGEEYSFEKFLEYDGVNRKTKAAAASYPVSGRHFEPTAPPVILP